MKAMDSSDNREKGDDASRSLPATTGFSFEQMKQNWLRAETAEARAVVLHRLVEHYLPYLRLLAGPLLDGRSRRHFDSMDIQQTIAVSLLNRLQDGSIELESEGQLKSYMRAMIRNRIFDKRKRISKQVERGVESQASDSIQGDAAPIVPADQQGTPSMEISQADAIATLLCEIERHLQPHEFYMYKQRYLEGLEYAAIGADFGMEADAVRMRLKRIQQKLREKLNGFQDWLSDE